MSSNGYPYGGHHSSHHSNNSPLLGASQNQQPTYSMPPLQPGVPLLSTGPLGGPPTPTHGLPSLHQSFSQQQQQPPNPHSHHLQSFYNDPYAPSYTPVAQQQHYAPPQYVPRPISAASNQQHSPVPPTPSNNSSVISSTTHSQQPPPGGLPIAAGEGSSRGNTTESTPPPPQITKARSSVACALCRKQKVSCFYYFAGCLRQRIHFLTDSSGK